MAQFRTRIRTELEKNLEQYNFSGKMFTQDNMANRIEVELFRNGQKITATGTVSGIVKRNDGKAVAFPGAIESGVPYIVLPETAYAVEGPISILIRLTDGEEKTVIGICYAYVTKAADADYVTAGSTVVSIQELVDKLDELDPLIARMEAVDLATVANITSMIEDTQTALNTVNDIIDNSFIAYAEGETLVIAPVSPELTTGLPILPAVPSVDGTYILKAVVENGAPSFSWTIEE